MKAAPTYQLVLQFTATDMTDFDQLVAVEEKLIEHLNGLAFVDGHDYGKSEFNIFILTDDPLKAFEKGQQLAGEISNRHNMRAAYRRTQNENYVILWPPNLTEFTLG